MGTLHMSVQRGNETAVAAVGLQLAGMARLLLEGRCLSLEGPLKNGCHVQESLELEGHINRPS